MYTLDTPQKTDHPILLDIWEASARATHHFITNDDIQSFRNTIQEQQLFDKAELTIARNGDNTICGFIGVSDDSLDMIYIDPVCMGKGVGKMLIDHAIDVLKVTRVDVNEQNEQALRFYERAGFKVVSRSELDDFGKPFPLLHMRLQRA